MANVIIFTVTAAWRGRGVEPDGAARRRPDRVAARLPLMRGREALRKALVLRHPEYFGEQDAV